MSPNDNTLDFSVRQSFSEDRLRDSDVVIEITLLRTDGKTVDANYIQQHITDYRILSIDAQKSFKTAAFVLGGDSRILINCMLSESVSGNSLDLVFTPNSETFSDGFSLIFK